MPSKYRVREFEENGTYHVFNRGVEKRKIFLNDKDYKTFKFYLFVYLKPVNEVLTIYPMLNLRLISKNLSSEIELLSYCLMPNHFHFLIKQKTKNGLSKFMKQLGNAYTEYFNKSYNRTGSLMQGTYKAAKIDSDDILLHVSRYIHLNPLIAGIVERPDQYAWSSYKEISKTNKGVASNMIINLIGGIKKYEDFTTDQISYANELHKLKELTIED